MKRFSALVGIVGVLALIAPNMALASSSSTCQGYSGKSCASVGSGTAGNGNGNANGGTGNGSTVAATSTGTLPFTGLDVILLVAGGATLLGAGFVVRRLSRGLN
jgi:hypothetical protein